MLRNRIPYLLARLLLVYVAIHILDVSIDIDYLRQGIAYLDTDGYDDIDSFSRNTSLKELILRSVPFGNAGMTTIRNFTSLYRINIRSTGVTDISVLAELMSKGALLDTTPEAAAAGGATLDLRGLTGIDCSLLAPYKARISTIEGC